MQGLKDSARMIERWRRVAGVDRRSAAGASPANAPDSATAATAARDTARRDFTDSMNDDLNIAGAIAAINTWINQIDEPAPEDADLMRQFDGVIGVLALERPAAAQTDIGLFAPGLAPDPTVIAKLIARRGARKSKNFAAADAIRDELLALGYAIKDAPGGKVEVTRA
jgi:cysteinyl-tRNA synthetase